GDEIGCLFGNNAFDARLFVFFYHLAVSVYDFEDGNRIEFAIARALIGLRYGLTRHDAAIRDDRIRVRMVKQFYFAAAERQRETIIFIKRRNAHTMREV